MKRRPGVPALALAHVVAGAMVVAAAQALDEPPGPPAAAELVLGQAGLVSPGHTKVVALRPSAAPSLEAALRGVAPWRIAPGGLVVLRLAEGTYVHARPLRIEHPDGVRLHIVGDTQRPDKVRLAWPEKTDGIQVGAGAVLGRLDGVTLSRWTPSGNDNGASDNACGLLAENAGVLNAGPAVVVDGFYYGVQARYGGVVRAGGVTVRRTGDAGFFAYNGGHIEARGSRAEHGSDARLALGSGYVAEYGGSIDATGSQATGQALAGFTALSNGAILADGTRAEGNTRHGYYASTNGVIVAHRSSSAGSKEQAVLANEGGRITGSVQPR